ncbi:MAG: pallilysin-related adhesin [Treponema sp.]|nr:pallilysin-related adhesin [Treponema sp.]MBQ4235990.1 pallilysin-related adhesin [Treponema sp.]MBQ5383909.1 pallilysin-related adhesin [Treponema sp.]
MRKRLVFALFIIAVAVIAIIFLRQKYYQAPEEKITASRIVIPQADKASSDEDEAYLSSGKISMVPLNPDETLIATLDMDFDGDRQDDQVSAVKVSDNPFISLIVGLFSPQKGEYERVATISTPIRQISSFSYTGMDLTGDHRNALVYQGTADTGKSVLQAFFITKSEGTVSVTQIANLEGDGNIFIDQVERSDSYIMADSNDPSYSIWAYSTDKEKNADIETRFDWNEEAQQYVQTLQNETPLASGNSRGMQINGTTDSYFDRLDGLWYKIDGSKGGMHYIYVDKEQKQFLFLEDGKYELYEFIRSTPRNNGIYITARNDEITNFQRQIDISFNGADQFKLKIVDYLFIVSDGGAWNGEYKKMTDVTAYMKAQENTVYRYTSFIEKLESEKWTTADGILLTFEKGTYTAESDAHNDTGSYAALDQDGKSYIQFRSSTETPLFQKNYLMSRPDKTKDDILMQPYILTPDQSYPMETHVIILSPYTEEN